MSESEGGGALEVENLVVAYPKSGRRAIDGVTLRVEAGRTLAIVGPSGAGKSTLLRAIAGLMPPQSGSVRLGARSLLELPPQQRFVAMVFQDDALFARMSVRANLRFGLRQPRDGDGRIAAAAAAMHVEGLLDRHPGALSGGERQRVAVARALLSDPQALLLDEPLAHLDPSLRAQVRDEILGVRTRFGGPIVYVTHDHGEALIAGDELAVLIDGRIEDTAIRSRVFDRPRTVTAVGARARRAGDESADDERRDRGNSSGIRSRRDGERRAGYDRASRIDRAGCVRLRRHESRRGEREASARERRSRRRPDWA